MRTIIAGSRTATYQQVCQAMSEYAEEVTEVVCGGAKGADQHGRLWASVRQIPVKLFTPDWNAYGKSAGPIRNRQMADYGQALVAIWDGESRGTKNMIEEAQKRGLVVFVALIPRILSSQIREDVKTEFKFLP